MKTPTTNIYLSLFSIGPAVQADSSQAAAHPCWVAASVQAVQLPAMGHHGGAEPDPAEGEQGLFGIGQCWWGRPAPPQKGQMMSQIPDCPLDDVQPFRPVQAGNLCQWAEIGLFQCTQQGKHPHGSLDAFD